MGRLRLWLPRRRLRWRRRRDLLLGGIACAPPPDLVLIEAPAPGLAEEAVETLLSPLQPLREQFTAITGIGLGAAEDEVGVLLRRRRLPTNGDGIAVSYIASGHPDGRPVVFIHGSPGAAEEWARFLVDVPDGQRRIAVDRPGFGATTPKAAEPDLSAQAEAVAPLLATDRPEGAVVVGYSYGGPVALRLAADHPDEVGALMLIGGAADPAEEDVHPLQALAAMDMFSGLLPDELDHSNRELMALKPELEALARDLGRIRAPVTIVHGLQDTLVPPENVAYLNARLAPGVASRIVLVEEGDHFLPWTHVGLLKHVLGCAAEDSRQPHSSERAAPGSGSE